MLIPRVLKNVHLKISMSKIFKNFFEEETFKKKLQLISEYVSKKSIENIKIAEILPHL